MIGRKPVPTEIRRLRGDKAKPLPTVIGGRHAPRRPPALDPDMEDAWRTIVRDLTSAEVIDRADGGVIEAAAVFWGRARQARLEMRGQPLVIETPQGQIPNRLLTLERESWREFRALAESLPLSPWGRARLGLTRKGPRASIDDEIGAPPRLRAIGSPTDDL